MSQTELPLTITQRVLREPLVHFLGVAALLFVLNAVFVGDQREVIRIEAETQQYLIEQQQELLLRPLTADEQEQLINDFVDDEVLAREGRKRGFDDSSRIRTLLIQNMRFFIASDFPQPTEDSLRAFYTANPDRFETTPSVTYDHVLFQDVETAPAGTLEALRGGADHRTIGDASSLLSARLIKVDQRAVVGTFGVDTAREVLAIDDEEWHGPYQSARGVHFLRVTARHPAMLPAYEDIENWVETEWYAEQREQIMNRELSSMRSNYKIEIAAYEPETGQAEQR